MKYSKSRKKDTKRKKENKEKKSFGKYEKKTEAVEKEPESKRKVKFVPNKVMKILNNCLLVVNDFDEGLFIIEPSAGFIMNAIRHEDKVNPKIFNFFRLLISNVIKITFML